ncbi:MAG: hypothetical protein PVF63_03740 [Gammaproteobacteria bacterium]|jgi:hypothetical protein
MSESKQVVEFLTKGWCRFAYDATLARWVEQILPAAQACVSAPENAKWLRCGGTWFIGVNALPNAGDGHVDGGSPIAGRAVEFIRNDLALTDFQWDRGQVSVVYPGYPQRSATESDGALRYRRKRDAAHLDGVLRGGPDGRRYLRNLHEFILGVPLVEVRADTSPFVVWENSHEYVREAFQDYFADIPSEQWTEADVTDLYHEVRRRIFAACRRVEVTARPGEAYLVHRLALHGIAPWTSTESARTDGRMVVYFRPESGSPDAWLNAP